MNNFKQKIPLPKEAFVEKQETEKSEDEYYNKYRNDYNKLVAALEASGDFKFSICDKTPLLQDVYHTFFPDHERKFEGHPFIQKSFYKKIMYNACITFRVPKNLVKNYETASKNVQDTVNQTAHLCNHFPIMIGSELDKQFFHYKTESELRGTFFSGNTAYRIPLLLTNNRELPHRTDNNPIVDGSCPKGTTAQLFYYYPSGKSIWIRAFLKNRDKSMIMRAYTGEDSKNDLSSYTNDIIFQNRPDLFIMDYNLVTDVLFEFCRDMSTHIDHFANKIVVDHINLLTKYLMTLQHLTTALMRVELGFGSKSQKSNLNSRRTQIFKNLEAGDWFKFVSRSIDYDGVYSMSERNSHSNREAQINNPSYFGNILRTMPSGKRSKVIAIPISTAFLIDQCFAKTNIESFMREYSLAKNVHIVNFIDQYVNWPKLLEFLEWKNIIMREEKLCGERESGQVYPGGALRIIVHSFHPTCFFIKNVDQFEFFYKYIKFNLKLICEIVHTQNYVFITRFNSLPMKEIAEGMYCSSREIALYHEDEMFQYQWRTLFGSHSLIILRNDIYNYSPLERFSIATNYLATAIGINPSVTQSTLVSNSLVQNLFCQMEQSVFTPKGRRSLEMRILYTNDPRMSLDAYIIPEWAAQLQPISHHYYIRFSFIFRGNNYKVIVDPVLHPQFYENQLVCHVAHIQTTNYPITYFANSNYRVIVNEHPNGTFDYRVYLILYDVNIIEQHLKQPLVFKTDYSYNSRVAHKKSFSIDVNFQLTLPISSGTKFTDVCGGKGLLHKMKNNSIPSTNLKEYTIYGPLTSIIGRAATAVMRDICLKPGNTISLIPIFNNPASFLKSGIMKFCNYWANILINNGCFETVVHLHNKAHGTREYLPKNNRNLLYNYLQCNLNLIFTIYDNHFTLLDLCCNEFKKDTFFANLYANDVKLNGKN